MTDRPILEMCLLQPWAGSSRIQNTHAPAATAATAKRGFDRARTPRDWICPMDSVTGRRRLHLRGSAPADPTDGRFVPRKPPVAGPPPMIAAWPQILREC